MMMIRPVRNDRFRMQTLIGQCSQNRACTIIETVAIIQLQLKVYSRIVLTTSIESES
jgi:hypothetical protein